MNAQHQQTGPISEEVLDKFFTARNVFSVCDSCGAEKFRVIRTLDTDHVPVIFGVPPSMHITKSTALILTLRVCINCGNTKFYMNSIIEQELSKSNLFLVDRCDISSNIEKNDITRQREIQLSVLKNEVAELRLDLRAMREMLIRIGERIEDSIKSDSMGIILKQLSNRPGTLKMIVIILSVGVFLIASRPSFEHLTRGWLGDIGRVLNIRSRP